MANDAPSVARQQHGGGRNVGAVRLSRLLCNR
jgi:hypothetical protein